jgi:hypothetical protein
LSLVVALKPSAKLQEAFVAFLGTDCDHRVDEGLLASCERSDAVFTVIEPEHIDD